MTVDEDALAPQPTLDEAEPERKAKDRDAELTSRKSIREDAEEIIGDVDKGFERKKERAEAIKDHWNAYNNNLSDRQFYSGTSQVAVPFIHDAVEARKTRFANQLFPPSSKFVEVVTEDGEIPHATISLLEYYIRRLHLKTQVVEPMCVNGDCEGQYSIYVGWDEITREVTRKIRKPVEVEGMEVPEDVAEPVDDMETKEVKDAGPVVEVLLDNDLLVLPLTARSIEHAIEAGGSVTILRRWSKAEIKRRKAKKEISSKAADELLEAMGNNPRARTQDTAKEQGKAAGVKVQHDDKVAYVYETWAKMDVGGGERRLCRIYAAGREHVLSVKRCPYWCDQVPVLSVAIDKQAGVFNGRAPVADVLDLWILANDMTNEAADSAHYSAAPIIMSDPAKNPRVSTMVYSPLAVWLTSPQDTQFAKVPEMWREGFERVLEVRAQIFQTLGVNPSMIPGTTGGKKKMSQAEVAQEQQVDILTTVSAIEVIEENILTPLLSRIIEYDHQYRDNALTIRGFGEVGRKVVMEEIEPQQLHRRYDFRWFGVEAARNAAQMQQQIAAVNVVRGIPPQQYPGYKLNLAPVITQMFENVFGPRIAPLVFSKEDPISVDPMTENDMMEHGFDVKTHAGDDDMQHLQAHMQAMQQTMDPHGTLRRHMGEHQHQLQMKQQAQAQQGQGQPGGAPGGPAPGGQPGPPQSQPGAPGQIPPDQMAAAGAPQMPRK